MSDAATTRVVGERDGLRVTIERWPHAHFGEGFQLRLMVGLTIKAEVAYVHQSCVAELELALERIGMRREVSA